MAAREEREMWASTRLTACPRLSLGWSGWRVTRPCESMTPAASTSAESMPSRGKTTSECVEEDEQ